MHFVSSEYDSEKGNTTHFKRKLTNLAMFLKNLAVSSLHEFEISLGAHLENMTPPKLFC